MHKSVNSKHRQERDETLGRVIGSNLLSLLKIFGMLRACIPNH